MKRVTISLVVMLASCAYWLWPRAVYAAACTPDWNITITATDSQGSPSSSSAMFGVAPTATTNNDGLGCDVQAPPAPPSGIYATFKSADNHNLLTDIRPNDQANQWTLTAALNNAGHHPLTLSWDPASLMGSGTYLLTNDTYFDGFNDAREPLVVDMRAASSATFYQLSAPANTIRERVFSIVYTPLTIHKSADDTIPDLGQTVNYTVVLTNSGSADLSGVHVVDPVPTGLTFINGSAALSGHTAGTTGNAPAIASGITVPANSQVTLTYQMSVTATTIGTTITNTVSVTSTGITKGLTANAAITAGDKTPPVLNLPSNITVEATSTAGATVTYSATATDAVDTNPNVVCTPTSGSTFALGTTTVNCTATDANNNQSSGSFTVTVQDTTAPVLSLPSTITQTTSNAQGVAVTFSATATDAVTASPNVVCSPTSGSTFAIGTTTVNCTATDGANNQGGGSFQVVIVYQLSVTTNAGWNLMSIPLVADSMALSALFPEATTAYAYNGSGYVTTDTLSTGVGYWVNFPAGKTYTISGQPYSGVGKVAVQAGWNLIGPYETAATTFFIQSPNAIESNIFDYNGGYNIQTTLNPWSGYWVKVTSAGEIFYNGSEVRRGTPVALDQFAPAACASDWSLPIDVSHADSSRQIVLGVAASATDAIDASCGEAALPPVAPNGLDVRLILPDGSGSWADFRPNSTNNWAIELGSDSGTTMLRWNSADLTGIDATLNIFNAGQLTQIDMSQQQSAQILNGSKVSIAASASPTAVTLNHVSSTTPFSAVWLLLAVLLGVLATARRLTGHA